MERVQLKKGDNVTPDRIIVRSWGYNFNLFGFIGKKLRDRAVGFGRTYALSFDGESIYTTIKAPIHKVIHMEHNTDDMLDFRYYEHENLLSVWISDSKTIVPQLRAFERAYRTGDLQLFDIDTVNLIFISDGYAVKCKFDELDQVEIDENWDWRAYHVMPPSLKKLVIDKNWRHEYFNEADRVWVKRHGNIDPAYWHLLMYEE